MSSHARSREEERRLSVRTLIIASIASAMAAIITSQFWIRGTPIAAAVTPVIVTLVSELLNRPTQKIVERLTTETDALPLETDALPEAAGAGPPPRDEEYHPSPAREPPPAPLGHDAPVSRAPGRQEQRAPGRDTPDYRVYRSGPVTSRGLPWKTILVTAALAFALAAAALTLPEVIAGQSVGKGDRNFTLWGGDDRDKDEGSSQPAQTMPEQTVPEQTQPDSEATEPDETVTSPAPQPKRTVPTEPETTPPPAGQATPAPKSGTPAPDEP